MALVIVGFGLLAAIALTLLGIETWRSSHRTGPVQRGKRSRQIDYKKYL